MFSSRQIILAAALFAAACATEPSLPPELTDAEFTQLMDATTVRDSPGGDSFKEVRSITALLERRDLTQEQRLRALLSRASKRATTAEDRMGAIADYQAVLDLAPEGHRFIEQVTRDKAYAETQLGHLNRRIAAGPASDPEQYFADLLASGRHEEAAAFFRQGTSKPRYAVERLHKLGYLCEGEGYSGPTYTWGYDNTPKFTVRWCDTKAGG